MVADVLTAVGTIGALGAVFGGLLALASRVFYVEQNPRIEELLDALPGANCGGCGCAGCSAFAEAMNDNTDLVGGCPAGGDECTARCAEILGVKLTKNTRLAAFVRCAGGTHTEAKYVYEGIVDCHAAIKLDGGPTRCPDGCVGMGSCLRSCRFGAISMRNGVAFIDHEKCTGCLACIKTCPKNIIEAMPHNKDIDVMCSSHLRGGALRAVCNIGCLGCKICEKTCRYDAIHVVENLATVDFDKCVGCGECAEKCPRHLIFDAQLDRDDDAGKELVYRN